MKYSVTRATCDHSADKCFLVWSTCNTVVNQNIHLLPADTESQTMVELPTFYFPTPPNNRRFPSKAVNYSAISL